MLRFAIVTALALGVGAAAILFVVRGIVTTQAEDSAIAHAQLVVDAVLTPMLQPSDLTGRVSPAREKQLDRLFRRRALIDGTQKVAIATSGGLVTYSTDHMLIGKRLSLPAIGASARGSIISSVGSATGGGSSAKKLQTFAPLPLAKGAKPGVAIVEQDYSAVAAAAGRAFFPVAAVLETVLVVLFVLLLPLLRRVSIRIERQMEQIERAAYFDDLTGIPNRRLFSELISDAVAATGSAPRGPAVLLLDLDHFRDVNDTLGHQYGDVLLQALGTRLSGVLDNSATLARLGGDEFGILLPRATESKAISLAERVLAALEEPVVVADIPLGVETGIGIAVSPAHGVDADTLLRHADIAMYSAKSLHAGYALYDPSVDTHTADRLSLVAELRQALADGQLAVVYQPKARLADHEITGFEALVRWHHPTRGLVSPEEFIPIAERTGLIRALTGYVLDVAVRQCRAWAEIGLELNVSVNLSATDIVNPKLPDEVAALLQREHVRPGMLGLEVTETSVMVDPAGARRVLLRLRETGVRLSIDDFGIGHSSLAYLKALPVDELKIDRSFVLGMASGRNDTTIVRSTIALGRNLGLQVVAEGVEIIEAWNELRAFGCTEAQGYLIGPPIAPDEVTDWLSSLPSNAPPPAQTPDVLYGSRALSSATG